MQTNYKMSVYGRPTMTSIIGGSCMEERGDLLFELKNIQSNKTYRPTRQNQMKTTEKERKSISCNFYISLIFVCINLNIVDKSGKFCEINYHLSHSPFSPQSIKLLLKKNQTCDVDIFHQQCVLY